MNDKSVKYIEKDVSILKIVLHSAILNYPYEDRGLRTLGHSC